MISETTNLDSLIRTLDKLQVQRQPLEPHAIKDLAEPDKILYATLLVMLITNQPITENQTRLLEMLLSCMGLEDDLQPLYANIPNIDKNSVLAFCELCDANDLAVSFLMDALTLCRLDNPLSDAQSKSLSELVNLLELDATSLTDVLHLSNTVLGEEVEISADTDDETITTLTKLRLDFDYDKLKPWHEFGYNLVTLDKLKTGALEGIWLLCGEFELNNDLELNKAIIIFANNSFLRVVTDNLTLNQCKLIFPKLETSNVNNLNILDSSIINGCVNLYQSQNIILNNTKILLNKYNVNYKNLSEFVVKNFSNMQISSCNVSMFNSSGLNIESGSNLEITNVIFKIESNEIHQYKALKLSRINNYNLTDSLFNFKNSNIYCIYDDIQSGKKYITNTKFIYVGNRAEDSVLDKTNYPNIHISSYNNSSDHILFDNCSFIEISIHLITEKTRRTFINSDFIESQVSINNTTISKSVFENCNFQAENLKEIIKV